MVMPRRFSSSRRSASMPVRALTSAVLPWSMCPAVPMMIDFIYFCRFAPKPLCDPSLLKILLPCIEPLGEHGPRGFHLTKDCRFAPKPLCDPSLFKILLPCIEPLGEHGPRGVRQV